MKTHFNINFLEDATETLRAIAHPIRIAIVDMLFKNKELSVSEIHEQLQIEQAVASHHLRILKNKKVVAITLGSGSTNAAQHAFEKIIKNKNADLMCSRSFWLMRPNGESRTGEGNVAVATKKVHEWAHEICGQLINKSALNEYSGQ